MARQRNKGGKWLKVVLIIVLIIGAVGAWIVFGPNTGRMKQGEYLYIKTGSTYTQVIEQLKEGDYIREIIGFDLLAKQAGYPDRVKAGKYHIEPGMSNYAIVRMLRSGKQTPVKLVLNKLRTKQDFVAFVGKSLEADSAKMKTLLNDNTFLGEYGLDSNTAMCGIMPDTYEFFWNTPANKVFQKIAKNYTRFWNDERKQQAASKGLTPPQAIIMASIVEEETNKTSDKPLIASVYINRIKKGMRLQADPTVKFAIGNFAIRRVTGVHLAYASPYNTYLNAGLPPGPICTPSKSSINAVLNAPATDYVYFCASPALDGSSLFAASYNEHMKNARLYQQALNERGIH